uniref:Succinate-CoA ligase GDP-forming subunit beta n=1 Tax=Leptobrachium leishanense TaxID=445787 RepID=A0A8C5R7B7_9ANUR
MAAPMAAQAGKVLRSFAIRTSLLNRTQGVQVTSRRWLNLQEYQSKKLMADNGVTVQRFFVADSASDALQAAKRLIVCFDAKINFDDNAEFRQKEIFAMDDTSETDPIESEAASYDLKYIGMEGNIACFVNGAGLAMATCDIIDLYGGKPANFLDLGGGVKEAQVYQAFKLLTADPKVEAILVNIFGGIVNCAIVANGITKACRELELKVPLVVRLEGTNVTEAKRILSESGLPITSANNLDDAAKKAVASISKK